MEIMQHIAESPSLSDDMVTDILVRLPVKSILKFRSVSKSWFSIINSPSFINNHLKRQKVTNKNNYALIRYRDFGGFLDTEPKGYISIRRDDESFTEYYKPDIRLNLKYLWMYGCCNGLVCVSNVRLLVTSTIFLWNPAIRKLKALPKTRICYDFNRDCHAYLAFGFFPMLNDYKVVRIVDLNKGFPPEVEVYTLYTDSWHRIDVVAPFCPVNAQPSLFMGGVAYWSAFGHPKRGPVYFIVSFDMKDEVFQEVMLSKSIQNTCSNMVAVGESLYLFHFDHRAHNGCCDIWVSDSNTMGCWTKLFTTNLDNVNVMNLFGAQLCCRKNGELLLGNHHGLLGSYNLKCERHQSLGIHLNPNTLCAHPYVESLLLLDGGKANTCEEAVEKESSQVAGRRGGPHRAKELKKGKERKKRE